MEDRRRFSETGEARRDTDHEPDSASAPRPAAEQSSGRASAKLPEISFTAFVLGLSTQTLAQLGEIPDPVDGTTRTDLAGAQQVIDILGMLREKTRGNLDPSESALLDHVLYDLRMKYVERARKR